MGTVPVVSKSQTIHMATHREYLDFVLELLSGLDGISYRPMMGEYVLYYRGKVVGGVYDDCLLLKPTPTALRLMSDCANNLETAVPYEGAKEMLVADVDNASFTCRVVEAVFSDLPEPKKRK